NERSIGFMISRISYNDTATPDIHPLSLHDALPIFRARHAAVEDVPDDEHRAAIQRPPVAPQREGIQQRLRGVLVGAIPRVDDSRSEEHTSELQSRGHLVCRLLLEKKNTRPDVLRPR